jgi:hypothetical protein
MAPGMQFSCDPSESSIGVLSPCAEPFTPLTEPSNFQGQQQQQTIMDHPSMIAPSGLAMPSHFQDQQQQQTVMDHPSTLAPSGLAMPSHFQCQQQVGNLSLDLKTLFGSGEDSPPSSGMGFTFCPYCGKQKKSSFTFCPYCGSEQPACA